VVSDERGSAPLEFIVVGLLLLVPLVYLIASLGVIQSHALGAESGARHLARAIAMAPDTASADARAAAILRTTADEYGIDASGIDVGFACVPAGGECPRAGATMVVSVAAPRSEEELKSLEGAVEVKVEEVGVVEKKKKEEEVIK